MEEASLTDYSWKIFRLLILCSALLSFVDWRLTNGYVLGAVTSVFLLKRVERYCDAVLAQQVAPQKQAVASFLSNYLVMAAVLILAAVLPNVFNLFTTALGMMAIKIALVLEVTLMQKKEVQSES